MVGISLEEAVAKVREAVCPKEQLERVNLEEALGRVLGEDIYAPIDQPPFDRSPLDGIAVCAEDTDSASLSSPVKLKLVGTVFAGMCYEGVLKRQEAIRIMTGAPIPKGADCIIRQEDVSFEQEGVLIYKSVKSYSNYCYRGEDVKKDSLLLEKGIALQATHLGVLASVGYKELWVQGRVRVGILSTGDELVRPGEPLLEGKIYNANETLLVARLRELGVIPIIFEVKGDDPYEVAKEIKQRIDEVDVLLTTGGVSVGQKDIMHEVVTLLGATRLFWKVNMQPGTPLLAIKYREKLILALSGNPFAALATFELVARPVLAKLIQQEGLNPTKGLAVLGSNFTKHSPKRRMIRACLKDNVVKLPNQHSSGVLGSMIGCNCFVDIPAGSGPLKEGDHVYVIKL